MIASFSYMATSELIRIPSFPQLSNHYEEGFAAFSIVWTTLALIEVVSFILLYLVQ